MKLAALLAFCTICTFCLAQSPATPLQPAAKVEDVKPAPKTAKIPVPVSLAKDQLWVAIHKRDMAQKQISDLQTQFAQMQAQATQKLQSLQAQDKQAEDAIEAAKVKVYAEAKLDQAHYDLDTEAMEFSEKSSPTAKTTPAPPPAHQ